MKRKAIEAIKIILLIILFLFILFAFGTCVYAYIELLQDPNTPDWLKYWILFGRK